LGLGLRDGLPLVLERSLLAKEDFVVLCAIVHARLSSSEAWFVGILPPTPRLPTARTELMTGKEEAAGAAAAAEPSTKVVNEGPSGDSEEKLPAIKSLVEFYFADANYRRDKFMKAKAAEDKEGECVRRSRTCFTLPDRSP
jgi:hypothetical protein